MTKVWVVRKAFLEGKMLCVCCHPAAGSLQSGFWGTEKLESELKEGLHTRGRQGSQAVKSTPQGDPRTLRDHASQHRCGKLSAQNCSKVEMPAPVMSSP